MSVNGVGATFSGNTWRATVPLSAGQNTLSAIVTSKGGETAKVSEVVAYRLSPRASISAPATGGTYALDQSVATSFTCSEGAGGPGLASCDDGNGTNTSGRGTGHLNTAALGQHTYAVTAKSKDGKSATVSIVYTVVAAKISIGTARAQYAHGNTKLRLACAGPAGGTCTGTLTLTSRVKRTVVRKVHGHRRRITIFKTVALAHAHYSLRAGTNKLVVLRLTHPAKVLLAHARKHTLRVHVAPASTAAKPLLAGSRSRRRHAIAVTDDSEHRRTDQSAVCRARSPKRPRDISTCGSPMEIPLPNSAELHCPGWMAGGVVASLSVNELESTFMSGSVIVLLVPA